MNKYYFLFFYLILLPYFSFLADYLLFNSLCVILKNDWNTWILKQAIVVSLIRSSRTNVLLSHFEDHLRNGEILMFYFIQNFKVQKWQQNNKQQNRTDIIRRTRWKLINFSHITHTMSSTIALKTDEQLQLPLHPSIISIDFTPV